MGFEGSQSSHSSSPPKNSIGNFGNLENPTQMLSHDGMNNQTLHLPHMVFSSAKMSLIISFVFRVAYAIS